jgi:hypothetical protein
LVSDFIGEKLHQEERRLKEEQKKAEIQEKSVKKELHRR